MSPLFMDTGYESNSSGSLSAEKSNAAGSEKGEGQQTGSTGTKRQEKNRDAARKSRKKQTERADELHEELQSLEQSNSALQKEIALLKKDLHLYKMALERHKPFCCLRAYASSSSSTARLSVSPPADCQISSSPSGPTSSTQTAATSLSTSLTSSSGLQTLDYVENTHISSSAPTLASSTGSPAELFTSASSINVPCSVSFSTIPAPHSLFSTEPPSLHTLRQTNATPVCTSLLSNTVPSSSLTATARPQSGHGTIQEGFSVQANGCFSTLHPDLLDAFLTKQTSFLNASSNVVPPYSHLASENTGLVAQSCPMNVAQLHPGDFRANMIDSSPTCSFLPSTLQDPALQPLLANPEHALEPSYSEHVTPNAASLLSLLTTPSPLNVSQTTSSGFDGPLSQPPPSLPLLGNPSSDLSLSELLEINDWILQ